MNEKEKIGVIGSGFVGSAVREGMQDYFDVLAYDKDPQKWSNVASIAEIVEAVDVTFLCVPTPMKKSGECDLRIIEAAMQEIQNEAVAYDKKLIVVLKSTVPPGTVDGLNKKFPHVVTVFNPEFLTEANAVNDYKNQNRIIVGGERPYTGTVKRLFEKAFPNVPIIKTSAAIAEMVKYVTNTFLTTKVSYANEIYQICGAIGIDYDKVIEYAKYDTRLGNSHWSVPGPDGDMGYGGHCFPGNYTVTLSDNTQITLEEAYNRFVSGQSISVVSFDEDVRNKEIKTVKEVTRNLNVDELIKFTLENGKSFECTPEHIFPVKVNNTIVLKQAKDITEDDDFLITIFNKEKNIKATKIEKVPFNGNVYNFELESNSTGDDLFWVEGTSGVITHNCFPKDLASLTFVAETLGVDTTILTAAKKKNDLVRKNKDWESQIGRAVSED